MLGYSPLGTLPLGKGEEIVINETTVARSSEYGSAPVGTTPLATWPYESIKVITAELTGTADASVTVLGNLVASSALSGEASFNPSVRLVLSASTALTGVATVLGTAGIGNSTSAALTGNATAFADALPPFFQYASHSFGSGTLTANTVSTMQAVAPLAGNGAITANVIWTHVASSAEAATGSIDATATARRIVNATLAATATATGQLIGPISTSVALSASGAISANSTRIFATPIFAGSGHFYLPSRLKASIYAGT